MKPSCAVSVAALVLLGCQPAARIEAPPSASSGSERAAPITNCLRVLTVRFHKQFKPGTFKAELDSQNVTSLFGQPHNPGGTSNLAVQGPFTGGTSVPGGKVITVPQAPGQSIITLPSGLFSHKLHTDGDCSAGTVCRSDEVDFIPVHFTGKLNSPTAPNFTAGGTFAAEVQATVIPSAPLQVELKPTNNVSLYNPSTGIWSPGGQSIYVTIPNNDFRAPFGIRGSRGNYSVLFRAPGCQQTSMFGFIQ